MCWIKTYHNKNSDVFFQVIATDADAGEFGVVRYSLKGDGVSSNSSMSYFNITETSGQISLLKVM